jgi:hypothetical protein
VPDLFVRGRAKYSANLNAANPIGTVQSIEYTLRNLDKLAIEQQNRVSRLEKELADYRVQADRLFEHEERLKQLLARQAELNSLLDLDKGDQQAIGGIADEADLTLAALASERLNALTDVARSHMRKSGAIREVPIAERKAPQTGQVTATAVAKDDSHIAFATAPNSFFIVASGSLGSDVRVGEKLCLRFHQGRPSIANDRGRLR